MNDSYAPRLTVEGKLRLVQTGDHYIKLSCFETCTTESWLRAAEAAVLISEVCALVISLFLWINLSKPQRTGIIVVNFSAWTMRSRLPEGMKESSSGGVTCLESLPRLSLLKERLRKVHIGLTMKMTSWRSPEDGSFVVFTAGSPRFPSGNGGWLEKNQTTGKEES